ncbi:MAG: cell wall metabolism sensor histidine kinase WalK [Clostridiales bacterium]|nr:cell wall metabolism sensor histidine kinase WalK [Clostridiales bacterium]
MYKPGGKITIKIGSKTKKNQFYVSITDTGTGIDPKDLPHIFDRFYKDPTKANRSTGLGLTISKEIIAAHKGFIDAKSEPHKGSTFTFYIPFYNK